MTVGNGKPKQLLRPITTGANIAMNQSEFLAPLLPLLPLTCSKRGKNHTNNVRLVLVLPLIGLKTGARFLSQSLSEAIRNYLITFDSHLKTALSIESKAGWKHHLLSSSALRKGCRCKRQFWDLFTVVIQPLSTHFYVPLTHRRSTTVSSETWHTHVSPFFLLVNVQSQKLLNHAKRKDWNDSLG